MKLWALLFGMIWLVVAQFLLALLPLSNLASNGLLYAHAALGALLVVLAYVAYRQLSTSGAPARIQRVGRASLPVMGLMIITGPVLFASAVSGVALPGGSTTFAVLLVVHVVGALAILAHTTAAAVAYDMWEEREFERPSPPPGAPQTV